MKTATVTLQGTAPISFSKHLDEESVPKREGENHEDYDIRVWREKAHFVKDEVVIPGINFKFMMDWTAAQLGLKIQGRGNKTWSTIFKAGVLCPDPMALGVTKDELKFTKVYCNADGRRGSAKRVWRRFPILHEWGGEVAFYILDDTITEDIFHRHVVQAGKICGLGRYRASVGGQFGRFTVESFSWDDDLVEG